MARFHSMGVTLHDDLVSPPAVCVCDHLALCLAPSPVHAQRSRRRRSARWARPGCRNETVRRWALKVEPAVPIAGHTFIETSLRFVRREQGPALARIRELWR